MSLAMGEIELSKEMTAKSGPPSEKRRCQKCGRRLYWMEFRDAILILCDPVRCDFRVLIKKDEADWEHIVDNTDFARKLTSFKNTTDVREEYKPNLEIPVNFEGNRHKH